MVKKEEEKILIANVCSLCLTGHKEFPGWLAKDPVILRNNIQNATCLGSLHYLQIFLGYVTKTRLLITVV